MSRSLHAGPTACHFSLQGCIRDGARVEATTGSPLGEDPRNHDILEGARRARWNRTGLGLNRHPVVRVKRLTGKVDSANAGEGERMNRLLALGIAGAALIGMGTPIGAEAASRSSKDLAKRRATVLAKRRAKALARRRATALARQRRKALAKRRTKALARRRTKALSRRRARALARRRAGARARRRARALARRRARALARRRAQARARRRTPALGDRTNAQRSRSRELLLERLTGQTKRMESQRPRTSVDRGARRNPNPASPHPGLQRTPHTPAELKEAILKEIAAARTSFEKLWTCFTKEKRLLAYQRKVIQAIPKLEALLASAGISVPPRIQRSHRLRALQLLQALEDALQAWVPKRYSRQWLQNVLHVVDEMVIKYCSHSRMKSGGGDPNW